VAFALERELLLEGHVAVAACGEHVRTLAGIVEHQRGTGAGGGGSLGEVDVIAALARLSRRTTAAAAAAPFTPGTSPASASAAATFSGSTAASLITTAAAAAAAALAPSATAATTTAAHRFRDHESGRGDGMTRERNREERARSETMGIHGARVQGERCHRTRRVVAVAVSSPKRAEEVRAEVSDVAVYPRFLQKALRA
jgi:hypothetical protein